ncbi:SGNH/GDSL hydrolase family protein [Nocardia cyriacigeorgica]|uniref:SGNH/GDSL hydrolase family protein n=1 Tax=Nocardia cyriacigeorgica TaxID=135487 RepID=UPI0013BC1568|nr:SGNH/GDSL hydrolase family protein [Nocardia cyriacigeorgica]NEW50967.1 SGNH/GDSL hydrolase family protein [Nocardia cyriacigeorgica]
MGRLFAAVVAGLIGGLNLPAALAPPPLPYVALGDSYTTAPGILDPAPASPPLCTRSAVNYPHLLAEAAGWELTDVSCASAATVHMTTAQYPDQPPQFDALSPRTRIVTYQAGGNDGNVFQTMVIACSALNAGNVADVGAPCRDTLGTRFSDDIAAGEPAMGAAIRRIRELAPNARVFVVGYPAVLPESGRCYPQMPLSTGDVAYARGIEQELNAALRRQAGANGAVYVDIYTPSIGHDACADPATRWVEPLVPAQPNATPVHPNAAGQQATANVLRAVITDRARRGQAEFDDR